MKVIVGGDAVRVVGETVEWLRRNEAPDEVLAVLGERRGVLGIGRRPALTPAGRVWRLGVLLVDRDAAVYATGALTRAVEPKHSNYQSVSGEQRRDVRRLAYESSAFRDGESINYDAARLELDDAALVRGSGPLKLIDGTVTVEWAKGQHRVPLERYLEERRSLLLPHDGWAY